MNETDVSDLLARVAAVVEQFDRRCEQSAHELRELVQQLPEVMRQSVDEHVARLPAEVVGRVRDGIEQPVSAYEQRLREAGEQLRAASQALATQLHRAGTLHRHLVWKTAGVTFASLVLLLVLGVAASRHYYAEIRRHQVSAELLRAYNQADVSLCAGRLCVRIDNGARAQGNYVPVAPR